MAARGSMEGAHPMLQAPTAAFHGHHHHSSSRPRQPSSPEPDLTHIFWHPTENRPKTLYDINPSTDFILDLKTAKALQKQCHDRLMIYTHMEKAVKDEQARCNPAWWRRWFTRWLCSCGCGGVEVGLGYSADRENLKKLAEKAWKFVHEDVWMHVFVEGIMYFRAVWLVTKMGLSVLRHPWGRVL
jgi:hypothetical protein